MNAMERLQQAAETKHQESVVMSRAYATTLFALTPLNFILVVGAALLSLVAGASLLIQNKVLTSEHAGLLALLSSAFTIVHTKLGCEHYQGECKRLEGFHRGLAARYASLRTDVDDVDAFRAGLSALNQKLADKIEDSPCFPFDWTVGWRDGRAKAKSSDV